MARAARDPQAWWSDKTGTHPSTCNAAGEHESFHLRNCRTAYNPHSEIRNEARIATLQTLRATHRYNKESPSGHIR
eukprot:2599427-Karenia_brevis.AAC.1